MIDVFALTAFIFYFTGYESDSSVKFKKIMGINSVTHKKIAIIL